MEDKKICKAVGGYQGLNNKRYTVYECGKHEEKTDKVTASDLKKLCIKH